MDQLTTFITNHWQLSLALVIIIVAIAVNELIALKNSAKALSTSAVVEKMNHDQAVVFDLRDKEAFRAGHIIDSIHATSEDFEQPRMDKYKTKPVILVCAKGLQSPALAIKLRSKGFVDPMVLAGGMTSWVDANLPLVKGK